MLRLFWAMTHRVVLIADRCPRFDDSAFLCMVPRYTNPGLSSLVESMELTLPGSHESFAAKKMSPWLLQPGMPLVTCR